MTDEEMAEEYTDNINGLELICSLISAKDKNHAYRLGRYEGFLAGLEAGRPKWHKVADGDLPKEEGLFVVYWRLGTIDGYTIANSFKNPHKDVIAWCEIPKFEEVEGA